MSNDSNDNLPGENVYVKGVGDFNCIYHGFNDRFRGTHGESHVNAMEDL